MHALTIRFHLELEIQNITLDTRPHGICYSHFGNRVRNGAISITQWGFISDYYKVKSIGQWGKILVMVRGFVDHWFNMRLVSMPEGVGVPFPVVTPLSNRLRS